MNDNLKHTVRELMLEDGAMTFVIKSLRERPWQILHEKSHYITYKLSEHVGSKIIAVTKTKNIISHLTTARFIENIDKMDLRLKCSLHFHGIQGVAIKWNYFVSENIIIKFIENSLIKIG